jgi:hemerythrin superfamily protein
MSDRFEAYATGLQMSHRALMRNLDVLARETARTDALDAFVRRYLEFLVVHHRAEEDDLFPVLRRASKLRSTDAAHLTRWDGEHRDIAKLADELARALDRSDLPALAADAGELRQLLQPHFDDEEQVLTAARLREMVPEDALADVMRASARANRRHALAMASFFAHSLEPAEQRMMFGETPWIFRRVLLGWIGERRFMPLRPYAYTKELAL